MMYTSKGKKTAERLWDETMEEFEFAQVREILKSMRRQL